jgi:hypothetical protein
MTRGRIHTQVADLLDRTVRINDDSGAKHKIASEVGRAGLEPATNGL